MCGRFTLYSSISDIKKAFAVDAVTDEMKPSYNIAPRDEIYAIIKHKEKRMGKLHWGLVPPWVKNPSEASGLINARVETLHEKSSFKTAFQKRRCIIPANGFYEWKDKQPWYCTPARGKLFGFAGLWETWKGGDEAVYHSCTIITADASESMQKIHDRMPLILNPEAIDEWLNPSIEEYDKLNVILKNGRETEVKSYPVSKFVDIPTNNDVRCIQPAAN